MRRPLADRLRTPGRLANVAGVSRNACETRKVKQIDSFCHYNALTNSCKMLLHHASCLPYKDVYDTKYILFLASHLFSSVITVILLPMIYMKEPIFAWVFCEVSSQKLSLDNNTSHHEDVHRLWTKRFAKYKISLLCTDKLNC